MMREARILDSEDPTILLENYGAFEAAGAAGACRFYLFTQRLTLARAEARDLVLASIRHDASHRPTAAELADHPFFFDTDARIAEINKASRKLKEEASAHGGDALEAWAKRENWRARFRDVWEGEEGKAGGSSYRKTGAELVRFVRNVCEHALERKSEGTKLRRSIERLSQGTAMGEEAVGAWIRAKVPELWVLLRTR